MSKLIRSSVASLYYYMCFAFILLTVEGHTTSCMAFSLLKIIEIEPIAISLGSLKNYTKKHGISVGLGAGYEQGGKIVLDDIHKDIRDIPPHSDDVKWRFPDIADTNDANNYIVPEHKVTLEPEHRKHIDIVNFSFYGLLNLGLRTSTARGTEENEGRNYFKKRYIEPFPGEEERGSALIYYALKTKRRNIFDRNSLSLPIYLTIPICSFGLNKETEPSKEITVTEATLPFTFGLFVGTNTLFPEKLSLTAEKGWHRWGSQEVREIVDLGYLNDSKWFGGLEIEGSIEKSVRFCIQLYYVNRDYGEKLKKPMTLHIEDEKHLAFNIRIRIRL